MPELIRADGIVHAFRNGTRGLDGASLSAEEGDFLVLAGRNGAGKTLLARHMAGLLRPQAGKIFYGGRSAAEPAAGLRAKVGLVFQDAQAQVLGQTLMDDVSFGPSNLGLGKEEIRERAEKALKTVSLDGLGERNPASLSGGEQRRLAIAGMLALDRDCLILDEPFANLDFPSVRGVLDALIGMHAAGRTLIVLTHEIEKILAHATRLAVMDAGRVVFQGDPDAPEPEDFKRFGLHYPSRRRERRSDLSWTLA
jgi:biotin transport system ATP-binding protein